MAEAELLRLEELCVGYGAVRVVDRAELSLRPGEVVGLVGESGCGKSTLGKAILRLADAEAGRILFEGQDITHLPERRLRSVRPRLQMIFQDPFASLNPRKTVAAILEAPLRQAGMGRAARQARVAELLGQVGLKAEHAARLPHEFSGGQRQRIGIARALALEPKLIVCDEAVSALDVSVRAQVLNLLADIRQRMGMALLFISHDLSVVRHISDRVAVMYLGRIVEVGPAARIFAAPRHPYTQALLDAVPDIGRRRRFARGAAPIAGEMPSIAAPPAGCRFHTRCPLAEARCRTEAPAFRGTASDGVACHLAASVGSAGAAQPAATEP